MIDVTRPCLCYCWSSSLKKYIPALCVLTYYDVEQLRLTYPRDSFITTPLYHG